MSPCNFLCHGTCIFQDKNTRSNVFLGNELSTLPCTLGQWAKSLRRLTLQQLDFTNVCVAVSITM